MGQQHLPYLFQNPVLTLELSVGVTWIRSDSFDLIQNPGGICQDFSRIGILEAEFMDIVQAMAGAAELCF